MNGKKLEQLIRNELFVIRIPYRKREILQMMVSGLKFTKKLWKSLKFKKYILDYLHAWKRNEIAGKTRSVIHL